MFFDKGVIHKLRHREEGGKKKSDFHSDVIYGWPQIHFAVRSTELRMRGKFKWAKNLAIHTITRLIFTLIHFALDAYYSGKPCSIAVSASAWLLVYDSVGAHPLSGEVFCFHFFFKYVNPRYKKKWIFWHVSFPFLGKTYHICVIIISFRLVYVVF